LIARSASLTGPDGLLKQPTKTVLETAFNEELTEHLGYDKHDPAGQGSGNVRNGSRPKNVLTEASGHVEIDVPRDRYQDTRVHLGLPPGLIADCAVQPEERGDEAERRPGAR
jgi:transposase-like protein